MWLIILVVIVLLLVFQFFMKNNKVENFSFQYLYNTNPEEEEEGYFSAFRTPLVQPSNRRKLFDSLTYDFPYLRTI